jgi:hypothetical protein
VVTANQLLSGEAVYLTPEGGWSADHREAALLTDEAEAKRRLAEAEARAGEVVGAYLAEARAGPDGPEPAGLRETLRTRGPTNRAHGKQETARP